MVRRIMAAAACISLLHVSTVYAGPDSAVLEGDFRIKGNLVFSDGSVQSSATQTGMANGATSVVCHNSSQCSCPSGLVVKALIGMWCDGTAAIKESAMVQNNPSAWEGICINLSTPFSTFAPSGIVISCTNQ